MEKIIELKDVDAGYPGVKILENVTFDVFKGEIFILLGGSGCGKSTVMKHMIGLNPVLGGELKVAGMEWTAENRRRLFRKIGVMYQSGALFGSMTCLENVRLPLDEFTFLSRTTRNERAMELLSDVELADAADKMPSELSGGMRKRVAIARAMALDPEVVFLDEPGAGLDPITAYALDELILSLRQTKRMTFVVVSHELDSIFRIADRAAVFDKARRGMIALGDPRELKETSGDPFVCRFFNRGKLNE